MVRTHEELKAELSDQLKALSSLAGQFGKGELWAAKLMATIIYVICHDGRPPTRSLITQLVARDHLHCISTAIDPVPGNLLSWPLMLTMKIGDGGVSHVPRFLSPKDETRPFTRLPFEEWWNQPVFADGAGGTITRKELVLTVRSKDGGGHFDSELDCAKYVTFKAGAGWKSMIGEEEVGTEPSHLISVWAIGWELHTSINEYEQIRRAVIAAREHSGTDT